MDLLLGYVKSWIDSLVKYDIRMTLLEAAYYRDTCVKYARHIRQEPANFPHNTRMLQFELESNCLTGSWKDSYQKRPREWISCQTASILSGYPLKWYPSQERWWILLELWSLKRPLEFKFCKIQNRLRLLNQYANMAYDILGRISYCRC